MSDTNSAGNAGAIPPHPETVRPPFPAVRILYALGFAFIAYFVLIALFLIAVIQLAMLVINGRANEELKGFSLNLVQYLWELLTFITFARDEQPFPIGPFPRTH
jgi:hypothetical protein